MVNDGQDDPKQPRGDKLKQFVQEKSPEELKKLEDEKAKLEAQYVERQFEVSEKAERLQEKIKRREQELVEIYIEIERLKEELDAKQVSTVAKIFNVLEIRFLRKEIGAQAMEAGELRREFDGLWVLYEDLQREARSRVEIDEAEKMIGQFYAEQTQALEAHEKDKHTRDVGNACRRNNALITHGFMEYTEHSTNTQFTVMRKGVTWQEKLRTLLALEPQISTASVRLSNADGNQPDGQKADRPFFPLGVLLKGGEVVKSAAKDMFSVPVDGKRLASVEHDKVAGDTADGLDAAINNRGRLQNEIVVSQPKVAALFVDSYFDAGDDTYVANQDPELRKKVWQTAKEYDMPLYQRDVESGNFFRVQDIIKKKVRMGFDEVDKEVVVCDEKPANVDEILGSGFELDEQAKEKMTEEILAGDYFKLDSEERRHFDSFMSAAEVVSLYEKIRNGQVEEYYEKSRAEQLKGGYLSIRKPQVNFDCQRDLSTIGAYVEAVREVIIPFFEKTIAEFKGHLEKETDKDKKEFLGRCFSKDTKTLQELYWHLWGFANAAKKIGDGGNAKKAEQLASTGVSLEEKDSFLNKRIGEKGEFKMTKDDLKSVTASQYHS